MTCCHRRHHSAARARAQRGATLLVAMIFMILLTLIVVSAIKLTNVNTKVVGNMQTQKEAAAAGQQAIEAALSRDDLETLPATQTSTVDINNSGQAGSTYSVTVEPTLVACQEIRGDQVAVDFSASGSPDLSAFNSAEGGARGAQVQVWNLRATVLPPNSAASAAVLNQGVTQKKAAPGSCA